MHDISCDKPVTQATWIQSLGKQLQTCDVNLQVAEVLEFMSDASSVPILVDADTGYGNFNNARRLVRKLEDRNIAGLCIQKNKNK